MLFQLKLVTTSNGNEAACIVTHIDKVIFKAFSKDENCKQM